MVPRYRHGFSPIWMGWVFQPQNPGTRVSFLRHKMRKYEQKIVSFGWIFKKNSLILQRSGKIDHIFLNINQFIFTVISQKSLKKLYICWSPFCGPKSANLVIFSEIWLFSDHFDTFLKTRNPTRVPGFFKIKTRNPVFQNPACPGPKSLITDYARCLGYSTYGA